MKVKRNEDGRYRIEGAKYVRLINMPISDTEKCYELVVDDTKKGNVTIFYTCRLAKLKNFLDKYENEKDLLFDYFIATLKGKYTLD